MKRFLLLLLLLCALPLLAQAEAQDITAQCTLRLSARPVERNYLLDDDRSTYWRAERKGWVEVTTPEDGPCYGVYITWSQKRVDWEVQAQDETGKWQRVYHTDEWYHNQFVPLDGLTCFRIQSLSTDPELDMCLAQLRLFGEGELPNWVQLWKPMDGKADIMVLVAHGDDELLFMGGTIPYYVNARGKKVIVVYLANMFTYRTYELLSGLWYCGVRYYPELAPGNFKDVMGSSIQELLSVWGEDKLYGRITELIRKYQPDVIVTHDVKGEYGHVAHRTAAAAVKKCIFYAADAGKYPASATAYGLWQVKKTYLHLLADNPIVMDWRVPLPGYDGLTAFEVTEKAFELHETQFRGTPYRVEDFGPYDNRLFGLFHSTVGEDILKNDFLENIE